MANQKQVIVSSWMTMITLLLDCRTKKIYQKNRLLDFWCREQLSNPAAWLYKNEERISLNDLYDNNATITWNVIIILFSFYFILRERRSSWFLQQHVSTHLELRCLRIESHHPLHPRMMWSGKAQEKSYISNLGTWTNAKRKILGILNFTQVKWHVSLRVFLDIDSLS